MSKKETIELSEVLQELLHQQGISIYKIVFFGSYVRDDKKEDSDIDILVTSKDFRKKDIFKRIELTRGIHRKLVKKFKKPFDLMYYSDIEWEEGNSLIINAAKEEGKVIYG